jgi:competence protein ComEA
MKAWLRALFSVSSLEQKGMLLLIVIILVLLCAHAWYVHHAPIHPVEKDTLLIRDLMAFEKQLAKANNDQGDSVPDHVEKSGEPYELFFFDPNTASAGDFRRLGLSNHVIQNILKYRMHGGRFYEKQDLKKIYGMHAEVYERIEPFINIEDHWLSRTSSNRKDYPKSMFVPADINTADSVALIKLRGIGPVLSSRIIRYRKLLGGFYDTEQLKEVYGLPDSILGEIKQRFYADTSAIVKISLNNASEKELAKHPYIGKYAASGIVRYRSEVHLIKTVDELKTNGLIPSGNLKKLKKYLVI